MPNIRLHFYLDLHQGESEARRLTNCKLQLDRIVICKLLLGAAH